MPQIHNKLIWKMDKEISSQKHLLPKTVQCRGKEAKFVCVNCLLDNCIVWSKVMAKLGDITGQYI